MRNGTKSPKGARWNAQGSRQSAASARASQTPSRHKTDTLAGAKRSYERYIALARDAASAGDTIESENYYQHAEHYLRAMRERADGADTQDERAGARQIPTA